MFRGTFAEINLDILYSNYLELKRLNNNHPIIPVIKADAYGHGAFRIFEFLFSKGIRRFAVATLEEALELSLSSYFINSEILVFCPITSKDIMVLKEYQNIIPIVSEIKFIEELESISKYYNTKLKFGIEIDTGMGRLGIHYRDLDNLLDVLSSIKNLELTDLMTHFPSSDFDRDFSLYQINLFDEVVLKVKSMFSNFKTHVSNSGGVLNIPEASRYDFSRCGLSVYGYYPNKNLMRIGRIRNSLTLKSYIALRKFFKKGESISYNRTYFLEEDGYIGVVPCGYADGVSTLFSNNMEVIINSKKYRLVGRVTMDYLMVRIDNSVKVGDEVVLFGGDIDPLLRIEEVASRVGLIPYEITCGISKRVPRVYV
ncbi:MAG: alanine racemase [Brevinematales bacterium]|nr:alanine racemase [Brevinematales bacterium]